MPLDITILVGHYDGHRAARGARARVAAGRWRDPRRAVLMDNLDAQAFAAGGLFLICSSTYGQGDVPDNAKRLYESLQTTRPDLATCATASSHSAIEPMPRLSAMAAGASTAFLPSLGARRIGEVLCTMPAQARCRRKSLPSGSMAGLRCAGITSTPRPRLEPCSISSV